MSEHKPIFQLVKTPMSEFQLSGIQESLRSAILLLSKDKQLPELEKSFGEFASRREPKGPGDKLVVFYKKRLGDKDFYTILTRRENQANWLKARVSAQSNNHPKSGYEMGLTSSFFKGWTLEKASRQISVASKTEPEINMFVYTTQTPVVLRITFESFADFSDLGDGFPRSFSSVEIEVM